jgi:hypothetical protein
MTATGGESKINHLTDYWLIVIFISAEEARLRFRRLNGLDFSAIF